MSLSSQLSRVRASLPEQVTLVAVSKTHPAECIMEAYEAGQRIFGENRPQELKAKYEVLPHDIEWHMIGHLQTNKVKYIAPFVTMIQSVDSARLVETIEKEAAKCDRQIDVLLEIHVAEEETKSGWNSDELFDYVASGAFDRTPHVVVRGVMGVATNTDDETRVRADFEALHHQFERLKPYFGERFNVLSMGMSHDYPLAVSCGATMVRVGSLIFGERDYSK